VRAFLACLALLLPLLLGAAAHAVEPAEMLSNPALETRARDISKGLRCLVCQNESIDDSGAELAHDLRVLVRERLQQGDSDAQVVDYLVKRYGDFVLLKPPVAPRTWLLWFGPAALLVIGGATALLMMRRRGRAAPAPLTEEERRTLDRLLEGEGS
jgi:cytochrome c-type biogenesis protein CcmH